MYMLQMSVYDHLMSHVNRLEAEEEQSLKLALRQPWVWSVNDFIFLASAYEGGCAILFLAVSSSHWQCAVSVLIKAELTGGANGAEISNQIFCLGRDLIPNFTIGSVAR